jgi:hypothetical protein
MRLSGTGADEVMASLCAVDLRRGKFDEDAIRPDPCRRSGSVTFRTHDSFHFFSMSLRLLPSSRQSLQRLRMRDFQQPTRA